jgi:tRNA nucleotidyltransferase (CCA-adding enzyme)
MTPNSSVSSVMHAPVRTFRPDIKAIDALQFAERCGMHHLPLLEGGKIVALICTCDLEGLDLQAPIREAITRSAATLPAHSSAEAAMRVMVEQEVGSLLVTENERVVGIVTREDLSRAGFDLDEPPGFRCESCGSAKHLKTENNRGTLCIDCRAHAGPETAGDETGVGD